MMLYATISPSRDGRTVMIDDVHDRTVMTDDVGQVAYCNKDVIGHHFSRRPEFAKLLEQRSSL